MHNKILYKEDEFILDKAMLQAQMSKGKLSGAYLALLEPILERFEKSCFDRFKDLDVTDYSKVDNKDVFLLQLEMKVVVQLKNELLGILQLGKEAETLIRENK